jgi:hypothetical protein
MAAHDSRVKAVAAVSPPFSAEVYWNVTLSGLRHELAALYGMNEAEMGREIHRITLNDALPRLRCPLMISGGGHDLITPGSEAWRIFEEATCDRELVFYPRGGHDCFNVLGDLRPRMVNWLVHQLTPHRSHARNGHTATPADFSWMAAEAVDADFADELQGEIRPLEWHRPERRSMAAHWRSPILSTKSDEDVEVVLRHAAALN